MRAARLLAPTRRLAFARASTRRFATAPCSPVTASQLGVEDGVPPLTDTAASTAPSATAASTTFSSTVDAGAAATLTGFADAAAPATDAAASGLDTSAVASAVSATDAPAPSALARLFLASPEGAAAASAGGEANAANDAVSLAETGLGYWPPDLTLRLVDAVHAHSEVRVRVRVRFRVRVS